MSSILRRAALLAAVAALALAPAASQGAAVKIKAVTTNSGFAFSPVKKTVVKGTTVKWVDSSGEIHQIAFYQKPAKSGVKNFTLLPGEPKKRVMKKPGTYKYRCTFANPPHSSYDAVEGKCFGMCGQIKVTKS